MIFSCSYLPLVFVYMFFFWLVKIASLIVMVSVQGSPDLKAAREVADYLGTFHHEFHFTVQVNFVDFPL